MLPSVRTAFLLLSAEGSLFRVSADSHATKSFRRPYGRHFFTFGESHVTRLTLPCNNRYSVAPLLTIPLGDTNCLSFRQAFLLLSAEGPLFRVSADSLATKSFRRPYGRHFCCFLPRVPFLGFRQIPRDKIISPSVRTAFFYVRGISRDAIDTAV